jgi:hypothetical protein
MSRLPVEFAVILSAAKDPVLSEILAIESGILRRSLRFAPQDDRESG